jgi:hypothetical protein
MLDPIEVVELATSLCVKHEYKQWISKADVQISYAWSGIIIRVVVVLHKLSFLSLDWKSK